MKKQLFVLIIVLSASTLPTLARHGHYHGGYHHNGWHGGRGWGWGLGAGLATGALVGAAAASAAAEPVVVERPTPYPVSAEEYYQQAPAGYAPQVILPEESEQTLDAQQAKELENADEAEIAEEQVSQRPVTPKTPPAIK